MAFAAAATGNMNAQFRAIVAGTISGKAAKGISAVAGMGIGSNTHHTAQSIVTAAV